MAVFDAGVNLSGEQVNTRQQAQRPVALVFMVARDARMLARDRWQVRRRVGDRLDAWLLVIRNERDVGSGLVRHLRSSFGAGLRRVSFRRSQDGNFLINTQ